jgi:putative Mn2+ efflux pump MntP
VAIMLLMVSMGMKGMTTFKSHFLEHHEKAVTGAVLIALGILALIVRF